MSTQNNQEKADSAFLLVLFYLPPLYGWFLDHFFELEAVAVLLFLNLKGVRGAPWLEMKPLQ